MNIRPATLADLPQMMVNARKFIDSIPAYKDIPYDPESMKAEFLKMMEAGLCIVAEEDGTHLGGIGACLGPLFLNKSIQIAGERFYWVVPDERAAGIGKGLFQAFHKAAKASGAKYLMMISLADERTDALYKKLGMIETEHCFWSPL